jgi:hypothetical protein
VITFNKRLEISETGWRSSEVHHGSGALSPTTVSVTFSNGTMEGGSLTLTENFLRRALEVIEYDRKKEAPIKDIGATFRLTNGDEPTPICTMVKGHRDKYPRVQVEQFIGKGQIVILSVSTLDAIFRWATNK